MSGHLLLKQSFFQRQHHTKTSFFLHFPNESITLKINHCSLQKRKVNIHISYDTSACLMVTFWCLAEASKQTAKKQSTRLLAISS